MGLHKEIAGTFDGLKLVLNRYRNAEWFLPFIPGGDSSSVENIVAIVFAPDYARHIEGYDESRFVPRPRRTFTLRSDGQPIHNAKCLRWPYMFGVAKNIQGEQIVLNFDELCDSTGTFEVRIIGAGGVIPQSGIRIRDNEVMTFPPYPQLPCGSDSYAVWMNMESSRMITNVISSAATGGSMAAVGAAVNNLGEQASAYNAPDTYVGKATSWFDHLADGYRAVFFITRPTVEDLTSLDDFFDARGYLINKWGKPDPKVRENWTYIQTQNADVVGACPSVGCDQVAAMLDGGVTFWNATSCNPGDYKPTNPDA